MGSFKALVSFIWFIFEILISLVYWIICHIANSVKDQFKDKYKEIDKDEARTTIKPSAIKIYSACTDWWDPNGRLCPLHALNEIRIPFIRAGLIISSTENSEKPLKGLKILDAGCGGGILSEPLARLGAIVTGIDPSDNLIKIADDHKLLDPELQNNQPTYIATTVEEHIKQYSNYYDCVVASEVIDHVDNAELFIKSCIKAVKPGGKMFFTAPNRTWFAKFCYVFVIEIICKTMPKGTFDFEKFITPEELTNVLEKNNCHVEKVQGHVFNFINWKWSVVKPLQSFYGLQATKIN